jgi:Uma2 family endonuclease
MFITHKPAAALTPKNGKAVQRPPLQFLESDGEPLDSPWHRAQMELLIALLEYRWRGRDDFYVGGNMFVYYHEEQVRDIWETQGQTTRFKGPDFFFIDGVAHDPPRPYWVVWEENDRYPDLIVELLSHKTEKTDRTTKRTLYERTFRTPEYFLFDFDIPLLEGLRLGPRQRYRKIQPDARGWLWSEQLQLWLGLWHGTFDGITRNWIRFYDRDGNLVPLPEEAERQRAEDEKQRRLAEAQHAETEKQRADTEAQRAAAAEAENARLKARLAELESKKPRGKGSKA